jgi:hypothetical protein
MAPLGAEEPSEPHIPPLEQILSDLYDSEINASISDYGMAGSM